MRKTIRLLPSVILVGAAGGGTGYAMIPDLGFALMTFCAALVAGACVATLFGRDGVMGWASALFAGVLATAGASGMFGLPFGIDAFFEAQSIVFFEIITQPLIIVWWLVTMGAAHLLARD